MPLGDYVRGLLIFLLVCIASCSKNIDTALTDKDLIALYTQHQEKYKLLMDMITSDAGYLQKFEVGEGRLGEYRLNENGWSKDYGKYVSITVILTEYSITELRYQDYLKLLSATEASVIRRSNSIISITISASGFVFGGCLSQLHYDPNKLVLEKPSWARVYYSAKFSNNLGSETICD